MTLRVGLLVLPPEGGLGVLPSLARTLAGLQGQEHRGWVARGPAGAPAGDPRWTAPSGAGVEAGLRDLCDDPLVDLVGVLAAGDELWPDALARLVHAATASGAAWVYGEEQDGPGGGSLCKPGWSPSLLRCTPYTGRPVLHRVDLLREVLQDGPLDPAAPEWDLALRAGARSAPVAVPRVLLTRGAPVAPVDLDAARRLLAADAGRRGSRVEVAATTTPGVFSARTPLAGPLPPVTVVVPTAGSTRVVRGEETVLVLHCLDRLLAVTDAPDLRVVVVVDEKTPDEVRERLASLPAAVRCVDRSGPFDFSDIVDRGVAAADTDLVLLLNDDTEVLAADWLRRMVEVAVQPGVGAVGAKLVFEDGRLQHVGVEHNRDGLPGHVHWGDAPTADHRGSTTATLERSAVTAACLLTRRDLFVEVGGFSSAFPVNYNDVDYCLRLVTAGHRVVQCNDVVLHHFESSSRAGGVSRGEEERFLLTWGERSCRDPWGFVYRWGGHVPGGLLGDDAERLLRARPARGAGREPDLP